MEETEKIYPGVQLGYRESEIVLGLVYPTGTDYSGVHLTLENYIKRFNYKPTRIRLSDFIREILQKIDVGVSIDDISEATRIDTLIQGGNKLCEAAEDESFIVSAAVADISRRRPVAPDLGTQEPMPKRAYILHSLKRPSEVELLRRVYGSGFYLIGVFASENDRLQYLTNDKNIPRRLAKQLMERDQEEQLPYGQRSRKTFQLADVFVHLKGDEYKQHLERFLDLVFGHPYLTPVPDEHAMFLAYSAALRSAQLGRQVGAAIRSSSGDIVAVGCNEVPAPGGGLYWPGPGDARDHQLGFDSNDIEQSNIVKDLLRRLSNNLKDTKDADAIKLLKNSKLMDITEYGRAVHAEMDALLTCVRTGAIANGGTLFTTTFPCHNCTRHIIAAGIKRVVYIEPYPKSLASKLHNDAVEFPGTRGSKKRDGKTRIPFEPFVGIGPRRFYDLFSMKMSSGYAIERKGADGRVFRWKRDQASPRIPMLPSSYIQREKLAGVNFLSIIERIEENQRGIRRLGFEQS